VIPVRRRPRWLEAAQTQPGRSEVSGEVLKWVGLHTARKSDGGSSGDSFMAGGEREKGGINGWHPAESGGGGG
jgi:hypothetical protein